MKRLAGLGIAFGIILSATTVEAGVLRATAKHVVRPVIVKAIHGLRAVERAVEHGLAKLY